MKFLYVYMYTYKYNKKFIHKYCNNIKHSHTQCLYMHLSCISGKITVYVLCAVVFVWCYMSAHIYIWYIYVVYFNIFAIYMHLFYFFYTCKQSKTILTFCSTEQKYTDIGRKKKLYNFVLRTVPSGSISYIKFWSS